MKKLLLLTLFLVVLLGKSIGQNYIITENLTNAEIAGTGTSVTLTNTTSSAALPVGFTFNYWQNTYTNFYINSNGTISFGSADATLLNPNDPIVSTSAPNNFIGFAFYHDSRDLLGALDLDFTNQNINYFTSGTAPNRILVVNFKNVVMPAIFGGSNEPINVQVQLYEGSDGKIEIHSINNAASFNSSAGRGRFLQVGVENSSGLLGTQVTRTSRWNLSGKMTRLTYCPTAPLPPINLSPTGTICTDGITPINLSAICATGTVQWYEEINGLFGVSSGVLTNTSVVPTTNSVYKVRCISNSVANCNSGFVYLNASVSNAPPAPTNVTPNIANCTGGGSFFLTGACSNNYPKWYDDAGTLITGTNSFNVNDYVNSVSVNTTTTKVYTVRCIANVNPNCTKSQNVTITVGNATISTVTANPQNICFGNSSTLTATGCSGGTVNWYTSNASNAVAFGTGASISVTPTVNNSSNLYYAKCISGSCTSAFSSVSVFPATPSVAPNIAKNPSGNVNSGTPVILTASGCSSINGGNPATTIKWEDGSTTNPRTVSPTATTTYSAKCVWGSCESASTNSTVNILTTITVTSPTPTAICSNVGTTIPVTFTTMGTFTGASFTVTLTRTASQCNQPQTTTIATATTATSPITLTLPFDVAPTSNVSCNVVSYKIEVTNTATAGTINSNSYAVTVNPKPIITASFTGTCGNQSATFNTQTLPSGTFQWKKDGINVGSPNTGTSSSYSAGTVTGSYTVDYTDNLCTTTSTAVIFNQNTVPTIALTQLTSPSCTSTLTATGCLGTVNWYRRLSNGVWNYFTNNSPLNFTTTATPSDFRATCTLNSCESTESNVVSVLPNFTEIIPNNPTICSVGGSILLNASSANSGLTYQWKLNGTNITGATSPSYTATTGGSYTVFTGLGACTYTSSSVFVNTVSPPAISITSTQSSPATITNGQSLILTSNGCISNGGTVLWSNGATTSTITVTPSNNSSYTFTCTKPPCVVTSSAFVVNVNALLPPMITSSSPSTCTGTSVTLTATGCGGIVTWSTLPPQMGASISVSPSITTSYTATCTLGAVVSANSSALSIGVFDGAITSLSSGNWTDASTWSCNCIPASCNDVTVETGHTVIIPVTLTGRLKNLTVKGMVDMKNTSMMKMK